MTIDNGIGHKNFDAFDGQLNRAFFRVKPEMFGTNTQLDAAGTRSDNAIRPFKVDSAIIGISAIDTDGSLIDYDNPGVSVACMIIGCARKSILVADEGKFERSAPVRIGDLASPDHFVTDCRPPARVRNICKDSEFGLLVPARNARSAQ